MDLIYALRTAIENKNISDVEKYINLASDIDANGAGSSLLSLAIRLDDFNIVKILTKKGANPKSFHVSQSLKENKVEMAKYLIEMGASACHGNVTDDPLCVAISTKNIQMVEFLLENGARFKMHTGLMQAIEENNVEIVQLLLNRGVSVNFENNLGWTPLLQALNSLEIVQLLLKNGACVNFQNKYGWTPVLRAATCNPVNLEVVEELIKNGADVNLSTKFGTPLARAVKSENVQLAQKILQRGGDINKPDAQGNYPIMVIIGYRDLEMLDFLIENNVNLDVTDQNGDTPFIKSVRIMNWPVVKHLVALGVDVNQKTKKYETPLSIALKNYDFRMFAFLMKSGADRSLAAVEIEKLVTQDPDLALCLKAVDEDVAKEMQEIIESISHETA